MSDMIEGSELTRLKKLVDRQIEIEMQIAALEEDLSSYKKDLKQVSQVDIPDLLGMYGLSEIKLDDGRKVIVKSDVSVTVKDGISFFQFLRERHDDSIIKSQTVLIDPESTLLEELAERGVGFDREDKIHAQTLKAYFREFMALGETPPESVNVYVYSKTTIK